MFTRKTVKTTNEIERLSHKFSAYQRVLFGATCCEKLFPDMAAHFRNHGSESLAECGGMLDFIWKSLGDHRIDGSAFEIRHSSIVGITDSFEEDGSLYCDGAVQFLGCLNHTLMCADEAHAVHMVGSSQCVVDYVEHYLIGVLSVSNGYKTEINTKSTKQIKLDDEAFFREINAQPLMQAEIGSQIDFAQQIDKIGVPHQTVLKEMRKAASQMGVQPKWRGLY